MPDTPPPAPVTHPIHRRYYAEDLVRLRRAGERHRYAGSQRRARIDPNPHQIDAVMFALRRIPEGGCILADEVGLGKTIEAGLVIAQLLAEGAERILIVLPKPLLGQWQNELYELFRLDAIDAGDPECDLAAPGLYLAGREYAGSNRGGERLLAAPPFDLCIIDEAHEVFAGIHRRYDRNGVYDAESPHARTAHRVKEIIGTAPVLLLTATPMQNSLTELWGLVQYVEPTGTLFGDKHTFTEVFCEDSEARRVAEPQAAELRRRLSVVVQRTLRRQAQEFLEKPFVGRRAQVFEYRMSKAERALYDDVTEYLLRPGIFAFDGRSRQLLLLGFHRRMASSTAALAQSLDRVAQRLQRQIAGQAPAPDELAVLEDLEEDPEELMEQTGDETPDAPAVSPAHAGALADELALVESFSTRARGLGRDSKARSLVQAVKMVLKRKQSSGKLVIFTESLTTQDYLFDLLTDQTRLGPGDITLFRGTNDGMRAREAHARWEDEVLAQMPAHTRPTPAVAVRMALVHEFATRSSVLISTEAGAKGLNLQFCDTLVNYDLPWNPQRIEQRIGRCHRYGQTRDVTVINFLAQDNEAQRLTLDILATKLDLFGEVLDMSDAVLQTPRSDQASQWASTLGPEFESELRRIWDRARTQDEVIEELRTLRDNMEERRQDLDDMRQRTVGLIESRLDDSVRRVFRRINDELPATLAQIDADLDRVLQAWLEAAHIKHGRSDDQVLTIAPTTQLPVALQEGTRVALHGAGADASVETLHAAHPLIEAAVAEARESGSGSFRVTFHVADDAAPALVARRGSRGRLALTRVAYRGFEKEDRLKVTAVFEDAEVLQPAAAADELLLSPCADRAAWDTPLVIDRADLDEVEAEELFFDNAAVASDEQTSFDAAIDQVDQHIEDRLLILRRIRQRIAERLDEASARRDAALGADARGTATQRVSALSAELEATDATLARLADRDEPVYQRCRQHAHERRYQPPIAERLFDVEFLIT